MLVLQEDSTSIVVFSDIHTTGRRPVVKPHQRSHMSMAPTHRQRHSRVSSHRAEEDISVSEFGNNGARSASPEPASPTSPASAASDSGLPPAAARRSVEGSGGVGASIQVAEPAPAGSFSKKPPCAMCMYSLHADTCSSPWATPSNAEPLRYRQRPMVRGQGAFECMWGGRHPEWREGSAGRE